jgi:uncharacterized membrane protein
MRIKIYILFAVTIVLVGCDELQWDLPRDNPLDNNTEDTENSPEVCFSKYDVYSDGNNDQVINPGESISLRVYLKNTGNSSALDVHATFTTNSDYITNLSENVSVDYNTIDTGEVKYPEFASSFLNIGISSSAPPGEVITFNIEITDGNNNTWTDEFTVTVKRIDAEVVFSKYDVYSDDNNDQVINPGESISLRVYLKNTGTSSALDVHATFTTNSDYITNLSENVSVDYNTIDSGDESYPEFSSSFLNFDVASSAPSGTDIIFPIDITDKYNNAWNDSLTVTIQ